VQFAGEPLEIGFNAEFLREGIESIGADEIKLRLISPLRPAVIEGGEDDPTYLIMPIRLPG
jgi:DNA polymerase-3 subunit beta